MMSFFIFFLWDFDDELLLLKIKNYNVVAINLCIGYFEIEIVNLFLSFDNVWTSMKWFEEIVLPLKLFVLRCNLFS